MHPRFNSQRLTGLLLALALAPAALAGPRTSASYAITTDTVDSGGRPVTSAAYAGVGSIGNIAGVSSAATISLGSGYLAQLAEEAPVITTQPASQSVFIGSTVTFTVVATSTPAPTYQWKKGGTDLSGATNAGYTINSTQLADAGSYTVVVANPAGTVTSDAAVLAFLPNFELWRQINFTLAELGDPQISGANAVYGADGMPNLVKYALGLEPNQNVVAGLPVLTWDASNWIFTYIRPSNTTDVAYTVEFSTTLVTWSSAGVSHTMVSDIGGIQTWRGLYPRAGTPKINMRLRITQ